MLKSFKQIIFTALVLFYAFKPVAAQTQTTLGQLAASMQPGTWAPLATLNINPTLAQINGGATGNIIPFAEDLVWDSTSRQVLFIGGDHIHTNGSDFPRFVRYSVDTNTWQIMPRPSWFGASTMHAYDQNALSTTTRILYHLTPDGGLTRTYSLNSGAWGTIPDLPASAYSCCEAIAYFPELEGLVFIHLGRVFLYKESDGKWSTLATGLNTSYHSIAEYNPVHKVVVFGGGNDSSKNFYKIDSSGTVTALKPSPKNLEVPRIAFTVDPVSGDYLVFTNAKEFYVYKVSTDSWHLQSGTVPIWNSDPASQIGGVVHTPIPTFGVTMFVTCDGNNCKVNLYKHAATAPPPAPPAAPTNFKVN